MKRLSSMLLLIALLFSLGAGIFAVFKLYGFYIEYQTGTDTYEELQQFVEEPTPEESLPEEKPDVTKPDTKNGAIKEHSNLQVDFEGLKKVNPDIAAWIEIPALGISYPVVRGTDNSYYLSHLFDGEYNSSGSIFVDCHNQPDFSDSNTIVYGHNMRNGSMFGTLDQYQDGNLCGEYPCFYIYIPGYRLEYQIFSCYAGRTGSVGYTYAFPSSGDFLVFLETVSSYKSYDTGITTGVMDKVVTLSTCVNSNRDYRFLVHGKLIKRTANGKEDK